MVLQGDKIVRRVSKVLLFVRVCLFGRHLSFFFFLGLPSLVGVVWAHMWGELAFLLPLYIPLPNLQLTTQFFFIWCDTGALVSTDLRVCNLCAATASPTGIRGRTQKFTSRKLLYVVLSHLGPWTVCCSGSLICPLRRRKYVLQQLLGLFLSK